MTDNPTEFERLEDFAYEYLEWMKVIVDPVGEYDNLLDLLHDLEFIWIVEMDENRAEDGVYLRNRFESEMQVTCPMDDWIDWPCSVLEMILALSIKIEDTVMYRIEEGDRTAKWFWIMLNNLDISQFDDAHWNQDACMIVCDAIDIFLNRMYDYDGGNGGMFPLNNPKEDQRSLEIWWQMHEYFQDF